MYRYVKIAKTLTCRSLAWLAAIAVCASPVMAADPTCGCGHKDSQPQAAASVPAGHSCCGKKTDVTKETVSCCSSPRNEPVASQSTACHCGDKCRCSSDDSRQTLPAVPANSQSPTDHLSVALPVEALFAGSLTWSGDAPRYGRWLSHPPEHTALETCALLSRFIC